VRSSVWIRRAGDRVCLRGDLEGERLVLEFSGLCEDEVEDETVELASRIYSMTSQV
jgi:hypothetical protein